MPKLMGNVMIVDDNPANLTLLEEMLSQRGYEVRSFPRGRLALAAAEHEPPGCDSARRQYAGDGRLRGMPAVKGHSPAFRYPGHLPECPERHRR